MDPMGKETFLKCWYPQSSSIFLRISREIRVVLPVDISIHQQTRAVAIRKKQKCCSTKKDRWKISAPFEQACRSKTSYCILLHAVCLWISSYFSLLNGNITMQTDSGQVFLTSCFFNMRNGESKSTSSKNIEKNMKKHCSFYMLKSALLNIDVLYTKSYAFVWTYFGKLV